MVQRRPGPRFYNLWNKWVVFHRGSFTCYFTWCFQPFILLSKWAPPKEKQILYKQREKYNSSKTPFSRGNFIRAVTPLIYFVAEISRCRFFAPQKPDEGIKAFWRTKKPEKINGEEMEIWVFPKIGVPQNGWFIRENPIRSDDLGVPPF